MKLAIISNPLVFLAATFPNISVAISLDRILVPQLWQKGILYGIPILQCIVAFTCSVITYSQCTPLEALWNPSIPHKCLPSNAIIGILYLNGGGLKFRLTSWHSAYRHQISHVGFYTYFPCRVSHLWPLEHQDEDQDESRSITSNEYHGNVRSKLTALVLHMY